MTRKAGVYGGRLLTIVEGVALVAYGLCWFCATYVLIQLLKGAP